MEIFLAVLMVICGIIGHVGIDGATGETRDTAWTFIVTSWLLLAAVVIMHVAEAGHAG